MLLYCWICDFRGLKVSQSKVRTINRWGRMSNHLSMAYLLGNICAKNYWNRTTIVEIIVGGWMVSFFGDTVYKTLTILFQETSFVFNFWYLVRRLESFNGTKWNTACWSAIMELPAEGTFYISHVSESDYLISRCRWTTNFIRSALYATATDDEGRVSRCPIK